MMAKCQLQAMFRYTWPCKDEAIVCIIHAQELLNTANALSFHLQMIPLTPDEMYGQSCSQNVREEQDDGDG
jgi:hypothetical protein